MHTKDFLQEASDYLKSVKSQKKIEAQAKFPDFPKAQELWSNLHSGSGGMMEVVETLGLESEYDDYHRDFHKMVEQKNYEVAAMTMQGFVAYLIGQLEENFYLFK